MTESDSTQLTPEQSKLAQLLAEGRTSEQIAADLGVPPSVVKQQMRELVEFLGIGPRRPPPAASSAGIP